MYNQGSPQNLWQNPVVPPGFGQQQNFLPTQQVYQGYETSLPYNAPPPYQQQQMPEQVSSMACGLQDSSNIYAYPQHFPSPSMHPQYQQQPYYLQTLFYPNQPSQPYVQPFSQGLCIVPNQNAWNEQTSLGLNYPSSNQQYLTRASDCRPSFGSSQTTSIYRSQSNEVSHQLSPSSYDRQNNSYNRFWVVQKKEEDDSGQMLADQQCSVSNQQKEKHEHRNSDENQDQQVNEKHTNDEQHSEGAAIDVAASQLEKLKIIESSDVRENDSASSKKKPYQIPANRDKKASMHPGVSSGYIVNRQPWVPNNAQRHFCFYCRKENHRTSSCFALRDNSCSTCKKPGHIEIFCGKKKQNNNFKEAALKFRAACKNPPIG